MKRRARAKRPTRETRRPARRVPQPKQSPSADPLDAFIAAGARSLGLKVRASWLAAVRANLQVTLRHGAYVAEFALPDESEPAPVFKA